MIKTGVSDYTDYEMYNISKNLKFLREYNNCTYKDVSEISGISIPTISRYELWFSSMDYKKASKRSVKRLTVAYGIPYLDILKDSEKFERDFKWRVAYKRWKMSKL